MTLAELVNMSYQTEMNEMTIGSESYLMIDSLMELREAPIDVYTEFYLLTGEPLRVFKSLMCKKKFIDNRFMKFYG